MTSGSLGVRLPCGSGGCRRAATLFGRFAGGVCARHAADMVLKFPELGVAQFHPEHRAAAQAAAERYGPAARNPPAL